MPGARIGADVGGTFTDVLALDEAGRVRFTKVLSTPPDYDRSVVAAVRELAGAGEVTTVVHGTTVATNAVLERRGALTALVTTAGFRDVLELRRMRMPHLYDSFWSKPESLVGRRLRFEVAERVTARGEVLVALDEEGVRAVAAALRASGAESVAVCLLHAHVRPDHEERVGAILRAALPGVPVTLSSEILREQQEYERTATTVVNAYVRPLMESYLGRIRTGLDEAGVEAPLTLMASSGGVMTAADGARRPVYALESGPAAGVVASVALARALGHENVITFDMGGTTAKASLIEQGAVSRSQEYEVGAALSSGSRLLRGSGELIRIPTIDLVEVGAGGGSIAWVDPSGGLHVGPRSAGASPGPACYGLGGSEPTVTDADVLLGYLPAGRLASGDLTVSREQAGAALAALGETLGLGPLETARGVHGLANAAMMRALRAVSTEKGRDPAELRAPCLRWRRPDPRRVAGGGTRCSHRDRPAACRALLGGRAAVRARGAPRRALLPDRRARRRPRGAARARGRDARAAHGRVRSGARDRVAADRATSATGARTGAYPSAGRASSTESSLAALVERFEELHEQTYGTRLDPGSPVDIRALRLIALGPERPRGLRSPGRRPASALCNPQRRLRPRLRHDRGCRYARGARSGQSRSRGRC